MKRSDRTQMYLDLYFLSLEQEKNTDAEINLRQALRENPNSPFVEASKSKLSELEMVRAKLTNKEIDYIMVISGKGNAVEIGTLNVDANGKVTAHA